jgi:mono/diheme cytochrome c family protein
MRLNLAFFVTVLVVFSGRLRATEFLPAFPRTDQIPAGRRVYEKHCQACHGTRGDGQGPEGIDLIPKPRNFRSGLFKLRSTPSGSLPTNADLVRTIKTGIADSSMPAFSGLLAESEINAVAEYVKIYSPRWRKKENYAPPVMLPALPPHLQQDSIPEDLVRTGASLFVQQCAPCHGTSARGDGTVSTNLSDYWGNNIRPADLTKNHLKSGPELRDVYKAIVTGLDGTPMASFASALNEKERWALAALIAELRKQKLKGGNVPLVESLTKKASERTAP